MIFANYDFFRMARDGGSLFHGWAPTL